MLRSEERWRSVFENSAVGVALTDLNGRFIATNPVYQKMLGYTELELQSLTFLDITKEQELDYNGMLMAELLAGERQEFQIEKQYRRKDGTSVWVRNNVSIVPGTERVPRFLMDALRRHYATETVGGGSRQSKIGTRKCGKNHKPGSADRVNRTRSQPTSIGNHHQRQHLLADAFR